MLHPFSTLRLPAILAALLFLTGLHGDLFVACGAPPSGSAYNPDTGVTTSSSANPDGSRTVTRTDADGNVISREARPAPANHRDSASTPDDGDGNSIESEANPDGSRTVTTTGKDGTVDQRREPANGGRAAVSEHNPETGTTTFWVANPDGSRTKATLDRDGNVLSQTTTPAPGAQPRPAPAPVSVTLIDRSSRVLFGGLFHGRGTGHPTHPMIQRHTVPQANLFAHPMIQQHTVPQCNLPTHPMIQRHTVPQANLFAHPMIQQHAVPQCNLPTHPMIQR